MIQGLASRNQVEQARDRYLTWTEDAEEQLRGLSVQEAWTQALFTQRYSDIRNLRSDSARPWPLINGEAAYQADRLSALRAPLIDQAAGEPDGATRLVLDTNVWLHFQVFQADWAGLVSGDAVVIVVPLVVLRELDAHKNRGGSVAARRSRTITARLLRLTAENPSPEDTLPQGVTLRLHQDPPEHDPRTHNDIELLDVVERITQTSGGPVVLVSDDAGVHVSARGRGLTAMHPPAEGRLPDTDETTRENEKLKQELAARQATAPDIRLVFRHNGESHAEPGPFAAPEPTDDVEVLRAQQELPLKAETGYVLANIYETSNSEREAWYREIRAWARKRDRFRYVKAAGHDLRLAAMNTGGTAASDVEIVLTAPDGYTFHTKEDLDPGKRPRQPERVMRAYLDVPDLNPLWEVTGQQANAHMNVIRQGGTQRSLDEPLWLTRNDGAPVTEGIAIDWTAVGVTPPLRATGTLHIKPRPPAEPMPDAAM
jgi:hypothetical protein